MLDRRIRHLGSIVTCICVGVIGAFLLVGWVSSVAAAPQAPGVELGPDHTQQLNARQTITYSHALTDTGLMTIYLPLVSKGGLEDVYVLSSSVFKDLWGDLHVVGEVLNNTSNNVNGIEINVTFYNSTGGVVGTASTYAYIGGWSWDPPLVPSQKSPFHIELWDPPTDWSSYRFVVVYEIADESPLTSLQVVNVTTHYDSYGRYHVLGEVENNEAVTVSSVEAIIALYDDTGLVINCGSEYTNPSILTPGQKGAFDISFSDNLSSLSSYVAQATGDPQ